MDILLGEGGDDRIFTDGHNAIDTFRGDEGIDHAHFDNSPDINDVLLDTIEVIIP